MFSRESRAVIQNQNIFITIDRFPLRFTVTQDSKTCAVYLLVGAGKRKPHNGKKAKSNTSDIS